MATYGSLLVDAGVGILDHHRQAPQNGAADVIIGLGGTGSDVVIQLKKEVYKQLMPPYDNIRFLLIDSDESKLPWHYNINPETEFFSLASRNLHVTFGATEVLKSRHDLDWLDYEHLLFSDIPPFFTPCRQIGRFLLVDQSEKVYAKLKATIQCALSGSNGCLTVHICSGLYGMTGSGAFLDVCYLVRQALKELGRDDACICGYFFLPEVNLSSPAINANPLQSGYMGTNSYAALQELDYCMNFHRNRDSFKMDYGFLQIDTCQPPVDQCYLISGAKEDGSVVHDGYRHAIDTVCHFLISSLIKKDPLCNAMTRPRIRLRHGASMSYSILGAAVAEIPFTEMIAYLGYRLFEQFGESFDRTPAEKEQDAFLQRAQLKYEDIRKALSKDCPSQVSFPEKSMKLFRTSGFQPFEDCANQYLARNKAVLAKNRIAFLDAAKADFPALDALSPLGRNIFNILWESYAMNYDYGPFFAQKLLCGSCNLNLLHAIDGFLARNQEELKAASMQIKRRTDDYKDAMTRMKNASFLNIEFRLSDYLLTLNNLYVQYYRLELLHALQDVLNNYRKQIILLNDQWFRILATVLDTLRNTFSENGRILSQEQKTERRITQKLLSVPDVRKELDEIIDGLNLRQVFASMMATWIAHPEAWRNEDENAIRELFSEFLLLVFRDKVLKTIVNPYKASLSAGSADELIKDKLSAQAEPMLWKDPFYPKDYDSIDPSSLPMAARNAYYMGYGFDTGNSMLIIPNDFQALRPSALSYAAESPFYALSESASLDRIYLIRMQHGLPLYAYHGLWELQEYHERDTRPGKHLYGRGKVDWNEWLPSPIPHSFRRKQAPARIEAREKALIEEFTRAEQLGIVAENHHSCAWEIIQTKDFNVDAYVLSADYEPEGQWDMEKSEHVSAQLKANYQNLTADVNPVRIESGDTHAGCERNVMLDFYLKSPVLNRMLHDELIKRERICREPGRGAERDYGADEPKAAK